MRAAGGDRVELGRHAREPARARDVVDGPLTGTQQRSHFHSDEPFRKLEIEGMTRDTLLGSTPPFVVLGHKNPGSRIPMVAAIDSDQHVLWKAEVAAHDPLTAKRSLDASHVAISETAIAAVYEREDTHNPPEVVVFDRATGARRFEKACDKKGRFSTWLHGLALSSTAAYVVVNGSLQAFDASTGKALFTVGQLD